jgi:hypothetical protein
VGQLRAYVSELTGVPPQRVQLRSTDNIILESPPHDRLIVGDQCHIYEDFEATLLLRPVNTTVGWDPPLHAKAEAFEVRVCSLELTVTA